MQNSITGRWLTAALAIVTAGLTIMLVTTPSAQADHEPANKYAAAGASLTDISGANGVPTVLLQERMKVSGPFDLVLSATAECSILTALQTNNSNQTASSTGSVRVWVEIDGRPVPVSTIDTDASTPGVQADDGKVSFCNRTYQRTVVDQENNTPMDGQDEERDFIRTRNANAFNWFALDVGFNYDVVGVPAGTTNNVVEIKLLAEFNRTPSACPIGTPTTTCAEALVGNRTLIAEPTNASVHETVTPANGAGN